MHNFLIEPKVAQGRMNIHTCTDVQRNRWKIDTDTETHIATHLDTHYFRSIEVEVEREAV